MQQGPSEPQFPIWKPGLITVPPLTRLQGFRATKLSGTQGLVQTLHAAWVLGIPTRAGPATGIS